MSHAFFRCSLCGLRVSSSLKETTPKQVLHEFIQTETFFETDPSFTWGTSPPGGFILKSVDDLANVEPCGTREGCCGPYGGGGMNLACTKGHPFATEVADCITPKFIQLHPSAVKKVATCPWVWPEGPYLTFADKHPCTDVWEFYSWLHEAFHLDDWYGDDLPMLCNAIAHSRIPLPAVVWFGSEESLTAGVPIHKIKKEFVSCTAQLALLCW